MRKIFAIILALLCFKTAFAGDYSDVKDHNFYFLTDVETNEILLSKNADARIAPSSMTKIMTAYVVLDQVKKGKINLDNQCFVSRDAWRKQGSSMFLNYGDKVELQTLLEGLLAVSGNDAAVALAQNVGGSLPNFVAMMNFKARELGLKNSHFMNPHGLSEDGHYMSLRDLATLMRRFYQDFGDYADYLSIKKFTYGKITQPNRNPLIRGHYDGLVGGKTGHTNDGGYGVVASVKRPGRHLIAVVNKAKTSRERSKLITRIFDYGFDHFKNLTIFNKSQKIAGLDVWMGNKDTLEVAPSRNVEITVPAKVELSTVEAEIDYKKPLYAPIKKGDKVAVLKVRVKNYKTMEYDLFAAEDIKKARFFDKMKQKLKYQVKRLF